MELTPEQPATNGVFRFAVKTIYASNKQGFLEVMLKIKRITNFFFIGK